ncbi:uncharacterized protein LOC121875745 [Homarus americanus]|uniref:Putative N-acetyltransferase-containing protein n=1 Tax=Homarus americanus TaxID=6706 RepID=A0A8J5JRZ7_HOMAM|nr:uncharacterized protein LOC121875745 [Homarus americanus]KAG7160983.1 putative N-acetyltransferase-containing protein [Homarus americanus]
MVQLLERYKALEFLERVGVVDGEALLTRDPLAFINTLIPAFLIHVPFQCVSLVAQTKEEHHVPSLEEVVEMILSLEGGLCYSLNTFMCILLRTLHLDAHVLKGSYTSSRLEHNHILVLVKDLRHPGDEHIIDVGCGYPLQEAVAVNSLPVTYYYSGLEYKYCRKGELVLRLHRRGDTNPDKEQAVMVGEWRQIFHFTLTPVQYDFFLPHMASVYVDEKSHFMQSILAARFPTADTVLTEEHSGDTSSSIRKSNPAKEDNSGKILMAFKDQILMLGPFNAIVTTEVSLEEWATKIKNYFPTIPPAKVDLAVRNRILNKSLH